MLDAFAALAQLALYAGTLGASGAVFAQASLKASGDAALALQRLARWGAILTILATLGAIFILILRLGGDFDEATISAVLMSSVGAAGGMRLAGAILLFATPSAVDDTFADGMRLSYAALIAASYLFIGHAAATGFAPGLMAGIHISLAGWWLASLVAMAAACRSEPVAAVAALVERFSKLAVGAIVLLIVAGGVLIASLVEWPLAAVSPYIATLGAKLMIVALLLALASYNKFRLTPRLLVRESTAVSALRRSIDVELLLIAAVLVATTLMTTYNAPSE
jgi:copper transport protein